MSKLDYLLILDFEATCTDKNEFPRHEMEIIEFPIVVLCLKTNTVIDEFHRYVKPKNRPILTKFCKDLTGISQEIIDKSPSFEEVLSEVEIFMGRYLNSRFVMCGDWDLRTMLPNQLKLLNIRPKKPYRSMFRSWYNIKIEFLKCYDKYLKKNVGMPSMLSYLNLKLDGRHHSGIDDSRNITKIVQRMINDNYKF